VRLQKHVQVQLVERDLLLLDLGSQGALDSPNTDNNFAPGMLISLPSMLGRTTIIHMLLLLVR
jgi:hypothetical protein